MIMEQQDFFYLGSLKHFTTFLYDLYLKEVICLYDMLLPLKESRYVYLQIVLHILEDYDRAAMDMETVSQRAYIHGSASSAMMLHASNPGWSFLGILLVLQEAEDKFGSNMRSWKRHALDSSSCILFTH